MGNIKKKFYLTPPPTSVSTHDQFRGVRRTAEGHYLVCRKGEHQVEELDADTRQEEIARILPAKQDYLVTTSEFDDVKARLARIENKRRLTDTKGVTRPSLRRASTDGSGSGSGDPSLRPARRALRRTRRPADE